MTGPAADPVVARGLVHRYALRRRVPLAARRYLTAVDGVDVRVATGETLAIVGESGSGKSTIGLMIAGLLPVHGGTVRLAGSAGPDGPARRVQYVSQDPYDALDPKMRVEDQVREALDIHRLGTAAQRRARVAAMLAEVGLQPTQGRALPHQLSGGQAQRAVLARALVLEPALVVLDEPLSALDVSVQAQILTLLRRLQSDRRLSYILITHDLRVIPSLADTLAVLYRGRIVEQGPAAAVLATPRHPYTQALIAAVPAIDGRRGWPAGPPGETAAGAPSPGRVAPGGVAPGCPYQQRCPRREAVCRVDGPALRPVGATAAAGHSAACHLAASHLAAPETGR